jgi:hypothetical protein
MSGQYWVSPLPPFHIADGAAYTGTAALGDISPLPNVVIPGATFMIGSRLEFAAFGRYTSTATAGTIVMGIYLAPSAAAIATGQALCVTSALTLPASQTNRSWRLEGNCSVRAIGTAGSIIGLLEISNLTGAAPVVGTDMAPATAPAPVTYDTTVPLTVRLGVTPSVTTGSWQCQYIGVRLVN